MSKKQFKTESKKILDMMINSIYTNREIFMRELISNASDAIDKLYFRSLTDPTIKLKQSDYEIKIDVDKTKRTLTISDNGCGMTKEELEDNLGTIAKSGSLDFKNDPNNKNKGVDIIGQFGVGLYSAFMVAKKVVVESRVYGSEQAYEWESSGADGYTIKPCEKSDNGTSITIFLKDDTDDEKYSDYLSEYTIKELVKRYSDYIRYPIKMLTEHSRLKEGKKEGDKDAYETISEYETLNSMTPIWKKDIKDVPEQDYAAFYKEKFHDYEAPLHVIRQKTEGVSDFTALLFIPTHMPYDFYTKNYEKGLQLYSRGVLITDKCKELLPDHYSFVKGLVDSADLSLNVSRETLQQDRQVRNIAKVVEKKITAELKKMQQEERDKYDQFFSTFGAQLKWGIYTSYGTNREELQDLIMFKSSFEDKYTTLKEYVSRSKEGQNKIYFAAGESVEKIKLLPQVESVVSHGYEVLYCIEDVDEFTIQVLKQFGDKEFLNVSQADLDLSTEEEKETLKKENEQAADLLKFMQDTLKDEVSQVKFVNTLSKHPVSLSAEGELSIGMEKTLSRMPSTKDENYKANLVLELNLNHPIVSRLKALFSEDKEKLAVYSKVLLSMGKLINGLPIEDPLKTSELVCNLML